MTIHEHLEKINACEVARDWAKQYNTAQEVWDNCDRADWLFWWSGKFPESLEAIALAVQEIANSVSKFKNTYVTIVSKYAAYVALRASKAANHDDAGNVARYVASAASFAVDAAGANAYSAYTNNVADYVAYNAEYNANNVARDATYAQNKLNVQIIKKHLKCPWHEIDN